MYALRHIYLTQSQQPFERLISSSLSFFSLHQRELYKTHECYWLDLDWCVHCLPITLTVKSFLVFCAGNSDRICGFLWWQGNKKSTFNSAALANDFHSLGVSVQFVCLGMHFNASLWKKQLFEKCQRPEILKTWIVLIHSSTVHV